MLASAPRHALLLMLLGLACQPKPSTGTAPSAITTTTNFDCDIVYSNSSFYQWPQGEQK